MGSAAAGRAVQELYLDDIEAATDGFSGMEMELSLLAAPARQWRFVESRLDQVAMLAGEMGAALLANGRVCDTNHWFFIPVASPPRWTLNGMQVEAQALHLMPAGGEFLVGAAQPVEWLALTVAPEHFREARAAVEPQGPGAQADAFTCFRPAGPQLASLHRAIHAGLTLMRNDPAMLHSEAVCRRLQVMAMGRLIECTLNPGAEPAKHRAGLASALRQYLGEHHDEPIFSEDLCASLGIRDRTLRRVFMEMFGTSPGRYLRRRRLQLAHRALRSSSSRRGVTEVCCLYGFFDAGRFAADYREMFGELPSATLQRAAGAAAVAQ